MVECYDKQTKLVTMNYGMDNLTVTSMDLCALSLILLRVSFQGQPACKRGIHGQAGCLLPCFRKNRERKEQNFICYHIHDD